MFYKMLKMQKNEMGYHLVDGCEDLEMLFFFLTTDGYKGSIYFQWLHDNLHSCIEADATVIFRDKDMLTIKPIWYSNDEKDEANKKLQFMLSVSTFVHVLKQWIAFMGDITGRKPMVERPDTIYIEQFPDGIDLNLENSFQGKIDLDKIMSQIQNM